MDVGVSICQDAKQLPCSPERMLSPKFAEELSYLAVDSMRTMLRSSTPIAETPTAFLFVPCKPFVANAPTDPVSSAELRHRESIA